MKGSEKQQIRKYFKWVTLFVGRQMQIRQMQIKTPSTKRNATRIKAY